MPILDPDTFETGVWLDNFDFKAVNSSDDDLAALFLQALSAKILVDKEARSFPDLATFGYFCRTANVKRARARLPDLQHRFGWGTVIHIAPANIPINFAFSFVMGFLAGNSNIVRLPTRQYPQSDLFLRFFDETIQAEPFSEIRRQAVFVRTAHDSQRLDDLIQRAQGLIVWGSDETVERFRRLPKQPRSVEVYFPNRISSAALNAAAYLALSEPEKTKLARAFYNDSFLVDQNACSSPSMVFWIGATAPVREAKTAFWKHLETTLNEDYTLDPVARIDKMLDVFRLLEKADGPVSLQQKHTNLWLLNNSELRSMPLRFGIFLEITVEDIAGLAPYIRSNEQTLTVFGNSAQDVYAALRNQRVMVDRIVPIGLALDIGLHWDGKDLLSILSRKVQVG